MKLYRAISSTLVTLLAGSLSASASALVVSIDEFSVTRNGSLFFTDGFADGAPPPSAPSFVGSSPAFYSVQGFIPAGSEFGGKLALDTANGVLGGNAAAAPRRTVGAVLQSNADSTNFAQGFKSDDTLAFTGIFDLTTPSGPLLSAYGIQVGDFGAGQVQQLAQVSVAFSPAMGTVILGYSIRISSRTR